jgi:hypothetical protein
VSRDADELLRGARDEIFHAKVLIRSLRNQTKTAAAALDDSEKRLDGLVDEIEAALGTPRPKEAQGQNGQHFTEAHTQNRLAAA